jgi:hypothetical protein
MPLDEEPLNIFDINKTSKSLTRKRTMSMPNLVTQSKVERTLSKRSKSLGSLLKSNGAYSSNYNSVYSYIYSSISINLKNANIENKYYIDFIRQRHAKIGKNHKKILDILDLDLNSDIGDIRLKEKVINTPKRLSGTLKKKSISKSYSPTGIMAF